MIRIVNLMIGLSSTVNLHWKRWTSYELDGVSSSSHFSNENVNRMAPPSGSVFFFKKNRRSFWSFLQGQFWHFKNLWRCRTRVLGCRKNLSKKQSLGSN